MQQNTVLIAMPENARQVSSSQEASFPAAVSLASVSRHFDAVKAVDQVDLTVHEGEFFGMLGPSGSGKTTCLRLVAGFEQPTAGHIAIFGEQVDGIPPYRRSVNTVFQDYALFPHMNVVDNVAYGLMIRGVGKKERRRQAEETLELVRLSEFVDREPGQLSGGQRQRVALARALINRPKVLLLDEPLGALDLKLREQMQVELKSLQRELGITFVFVTHDQSEALSMSDRVAVFNQGRVVQVGTPVDIYERPETRFVADFVGSSNILEPAFCERIGAPSGLWSLRPEKIRLAPEGLSDEAGTIDVTGEVRHVQYQGATRRCVLAVKDTELALAMPAVGVEPVVGRTAHVRWRLDDMHGMKQV
ncbi:ABC transporter ATP-binding protein [Vreelandella arcis]|uniref:Putative spermidine/putrescine transport system ATP-binding protein n=1 Tax=Vreelandella arcis TaxID=416873 RepID=A0A1H0FTN3_9GAMM|nr:ABC transporter ATP-binding protein [Halomonas arcis]SDN97849.1 putative spermidine/putrescine transport system ATP-binding protein [Halomonas arcis]